MSQATDYVIDNATGAAVRADLNTVFGAVSTLNSGATEPTTMYPYMPWADTANTLLKIRNGANSAWITVGTLDATNLDLLPNPGTETADYVLATDGASTFSWAYRQRVVEGTATTTTSGTEHDYTSLPSYVKRITLLFDGVSLSGTADLRIQIGDSGGVETTGYASVSSNSTGAAINTDTAATAGFDIAGSASGASETYSGALTLSLVDSGANSWAISGQLAGTVGNELCTVAGTKSLSGVLDRVRFTTSNGTDTFDAGTVNVNYEG